MFNIGEVVLCNMKNFVGKVGKMKIERDDLKSCPFCGNANVGLFSQLIESDYCSWWDADICCTCGAMLISICANSEEEAINGAVKLWNNRV